MKISSTHNHSTGSDGKLSPKDVVEKAISLGWKHVYFTDHYHLPEEAKNSYNKGFFHESYIKEIKSLREKYKEKIEVCFGVELDWYEKFSEWLRKESKKQEYDYVLGSIHNLLDPKGEYRSIESGKDYWMESARRFGGTKKYIGGYYNQTKKLVNSGIYDCVGHLDYIKVYNNKQELFSEEEEWYKRAVCEVLDLIKEKNMAIELNAGGIRKCGFTFPSFWIIKEAKKRNIPLALGLDSHHESHYDNEMMKEIITIAKKAGYKKIVRFVKRKKIEMKLI